MDVMDFEGADLYRALSRAEGSDGAAGEALAAVGIRGLVYLDGGSRAAGTRNYIIFGGADKEIVGTMFHRSEVNEMTAEQMPAEVIALMPGMQGTTSPAKRGWPSDGAPASKP